MMTIGAWVGFIIITLALITAMIFIIKNFDLDHVPAAITIGVTFTIIIIVFLAFRWYYNNTATGARALKTQQSELSNGIDRTVTVYDVNGKVIKEYTGHFDVTYDNDRILFDDEKGLRHIIYYPTGTVIVDEVGE